jgi:hypothetical protein
MKKNGNDSGSATVMVLGVLLFLALLSLGAYLLIGQSILNVAKRGREEDQHTLLIETAEQVVDTLLEDPTPHADSMVDPVWDTLKAFDEEKLSVSLRDISSLYGVNWVRKDVLTHSGLLQPGKSADELQQHRWNTGLHLRLAPGFSEYIAEANLETYFTPYSYFNLNICDEFALEKLISTRTGDEIAAMEIRRRVQEAWKESKPGKPRMIEADELDDILGSHFEKLFPLINVEPVLNIHFISREILYQLFSFEYHDVPPERARFIVNARERAEWSRNELQALIGDKYQKTFLYHYLGVMTWFWELQVQYVENERAQASLRWVLARVPEESGTYDTVEFRLIEEEISFE